MRPRFPLFLVLPLLLTVQASAGTIEQLGRLSVPRARHTALLQFDGRVVILGGGDRTIEVIDPASGTVETRAEATPVPLSDHAATALSDGRILLTGGSHTSDRTLHFGTWGNDRADLYDSLRAETLPISRMTAARMGHSSVLLHDGRVLTTGGSTARKTSAITQTFIVDSAEIFDPVAGVSSRVGSMASTRFRHTATVLYDGRVLIAGGAKASPHPMWPEVLASTEIFDPRTGTFEPGPEMQSKRIDHTATLLEDGRVLLAGGRTFLESHAAPIASEIFNPATNMIEPGPAIGPRFGHTATRLRDGRVLFFGGADDAVIYDVRRNAIVDRTQLPTTRRDHTATLLLDGTVLITGGNDESRNGTYYEVMQRRDDVARYVAGSPRRRASR